MASSPSGINLAEFGLVTIDMTDKCKQMEELLPDLAEGKHLPDVQAHVDSCSDCAVRLEQFRTMIRAATVPILSAPTNLIQSAKSMQRGDRKVFRARLFGSSLSLAHARSSATDFQLVVGHGPHRIRLMYSRLPGGKWEVTGRAPNKKWKISRGASFKTLDAQGGFVFQAEKLEDTQFSLALGNEELEIPSAQELLDGEST